MPFDERFLPDFFVDLVLKALFLVEALVEAFAVVTRLVEARLVLFAPARFLAEAVLVFLDAVFLVLFLAPREVVDFFEADRPLLDFLAADPLRAFVGILSSVNALLKLTS